MPPKQRAAAPAEGSDAGPAQLDSDPLSFLVGDAAAFLRTSWERAPVVIRADAARRAFFDGLMAYPELQRLAGLCDGTGEPLSFGVDLNAARYLDGRRETPNGEVADAAEIERLYREEGCTMQFHQPQRFSEEAWRLLAALEAQLGCLAGCNAYLTPAGTQGLAPHWDDVEIFVVQTAGTKRWRLYRPAPATAAAAAAADGGDPAAARARLLGACLLANQVSGDLPESDIGEPVLEVTLEVGDVLYLPRGTIHQAAAQGEDSAHLTVSTYQRWSTADLMQYTVSVALANSELQPLLPAALKAGLPHRWLSAAAMGPPEAAALAAASGGFGDALPALLKASGLSSGGKAGKAGKGSGSGGGGAPPAAALAAELAAACRAMADCLESAPLGPRLVQTAGDAMSEDFLRSRLPPHPAQLPPRGPAPTLADSVQCVGAGFFRLVPLRGTGGGHDHGCGSDCEEEHEHTHDHGHAGHAGHAGHHAGHGGHHDHAEGEPCGDACETPHVGSSAPPAWVRLMSCLQNDRGTHMIGGGGGGGGGGSGSDSEFDSGSESEPESEDGSGSEEDEEEAAAAGGSEEEEGEEGAAAAAVEEEEEGAELMVFEGAGAPAAEGLDEDEELARLVAAAGRKRQQLAAAGGGGDSEASSEEEDDDDEEEGGSEDEDEEEDEEEEQEREDLVFPAEFAPALTTLLSSAADAGGRPVPVRSLALPDAELQLQVCAALWDAGVLVVAKPQPAPKQPKQLAKAAKQAKPAEAAAPAKAAGKKAGGGKRGGGAAAAAAPKPKKARKA